MAKNNIVRQTPGDTAPVTDHALASEVELCEAAIREARRRMPHRPGEGTDAMVEVLTGAVELLLARAKQP